MIRSHPAGHFQLGRKHIDNVNLSQAKQLAQLHKAQSNRTGAYYNHLFTRSQIEILESSQHLTPSTGNHRFFRLYVRRNCVLYFKTIPASLFRCGQSFFFQYFKIIHYHIFAETAPAAIDTLCAKIGNKTANHTVTHLEVTHFLANSYYNPGILMSQSQRVRIYSGELSGYKFTVGRITQSHHFCLHQCLISIDYRSFHLSYFNFAGSRHHYCFHLIIRFYIESSSVFAISVYISHKA